VVNATKQYNFCSYEGNNRSAVVQDFLVYPIMDSNTYGSVWTMESFIK